VKLPALRNKEEHYEVNRSLYGATAWAMNRLTEPIARDGIEL
jgi:hypothetical protein